jgi:hypothetical protein
VPTKFRFPPTRLHVVTTQKNILIFIIEAEKVEFVDEQEIQACY